MSNKSPPLLPFDYSSFYLLITEVWWLLLIILFTLLYLFKHLADKNYSPKLKQSFITSTSKMETYIRNHQPVAQCYFCGEEMPPSQLELHVKQCGCVLEPCPDNCGLYVQRKFKNHHSSWCKKDNTEQPPWKSVTAELAELRNKLEIEVIQKKQDMENYMQRLEKCNQKITQMEELNNKLIDAITGVRNLLSEEQNTRLKEILDVKTGLNDMIRSISQLKFNLNQTKVDVEELRNEIHSNEMYEKIYDQFQEWKKNQYVIVNNMKAAFDKDIHREIHKIYNDDIVRSKSVNDLLDLNEVIIDTQDKYTGQICQLEEEVKELNKCFAEENIMLSGIWRDQLDEIKVVKSKFEEHDGLIKMLIDEQKIIKQKVEHLEHFSKDLNNLNTVTEKNVDHVVGGSISDNLLKELIDERDIVRERLKSLEICNLKERSLSTDTSLSVFDDTFFKQQNQIDQRLAALEKLTEEVQQNCNKRDSTSTDNGQSYFSVILKEISSEQVIIKRRLEILEVITHGLEEGKSKLSLSSISKQSTGVQVNGRLMWTISNFNEKLDEAKATKSQIESPVFYTSENGYKLQLRAHLNGLGQWEGRHLIVSLNVLPVPWDSRLAWPCRLKVIFCLRDQEPIHRKAKDIVKSFTSSPAAKGFHSPCLQMFIPHRTLYTRSYLKNDVLIIEVKTLPLS